MLLEIEWVMVDDMIVPVCMVLLEIDVLNDTVSRWERETVTCSESEGSNMRVVVPINDFVVVPESTLRLLVRLIVADMDEVAVTCDRLVVSVELIDKSSTVFERLVRGDEFVSTTDRLAESLCEREAVR